jgi:hypothetical protein
VRGRPWRRGIPCVACCEDSAGAGLQRHALLAAGFARVCVDDVGAIGRSPQVATGVAVLRPEDTCVSDRPGRSRHVNLLDALSDDDRHNVGDDLLDKARPQAPSGPVRRTADRSSQRILPGTPPSLSVRLPYPTSELQVRVVPDKCRTGWTV